MSVSVCLVCDICHDVEVIQGFSINDNGYCVNTNGDSYTLNRILIEYANPLETDEYQYEHVCSCCENLPDI